MLFFYSIASKMQYAGFCLYDLIIQKFCINLYKNNVDKYTMRWDIKKYIKWNNLINLGSL